VLFSITPQPLLWHSDFASSQTINPAHGNHYITTTNQPPQRPSAFIQEAQWAGPGLSTIGKH